MKAIYKQKGESLDYTNNGTAAIEAGELVVIEKHVGVAGCPIKAGETGSLHVVGVFEVPCKAFLLRLDRMCISSRQTALLLLPRILRLDLW